MLFFVFVILVLAAAAFVVFSTVKIVPQSYAYVVERLGKYSRTLKAGVNILVPFIDLVAQKVDLKEQMADFPPQPVITKDNVTMQIDTVIYYSVFNPELYTYGIVSPRAAIEALTATTMRNIIGDLELDEALTSRESINAQMCDILDEATDSWGIKVVRVEVKNILPPRDIQEAMEKQMRAERQKREAILTAEGKKESAIRIAEGEKEAAILRAQAEKESAIERAEGEAEAMRLVYEARAQGIQYINEADPKASYIQLEGFRALKDMADGQSTKIIVPSDLQGLAGTVAAVSELAKNAPLHSGGKARKKDESYAEGGTAEERPEEIHSGKTHVYREHPM